MSDIFDQLQPMMNGRHPDPREVAADRLLRLAETARCAGLPGEVVAAYEVAARRLGDAVAEDEIRGMSVIAATVFDPSGLAELGPRTALEAEPDDPDARRAADRPDLAGILVAAVCRTGSLDLGINLGLGPSGVLAQGLITPSAGIMAFEQWVDGLEPRAASLLERRVFADGKRPTLEEVGEEWGVTRERVRQVEAKTLEAIDRVLGPGLAEAAAPLEEVAGYVLPLTKFKLALGLLTCGARRPALVEAALRHYSGPWIINGSWIHHQSVDAKLRTAHASVAEATDAYGLLADDAPSRLDGCFASEEDLLNYFRSALGIVELSGQWSVRDSLRSRIAAALRRLGRPATRAEIAEAAGLAPEARVGSTLSALDGIVRADKDRWAFAAWVDDPYDGIVGEINQRIAARSGSVAVASLLDELPRKFGVSENSVMMYLQTPAYVIEEGFVRHAEAGEFSAEPPSKWADAFFTDGLWGQLVRVEQRHLEGYSLKVRFDIAFANGLRPGADLRAQVEGTKHEASVIWRAHDASWGIDVGRVSQALTELGFGPGDLVLVVPSPALVRLTPPLPAPGADLAADADGGHSDPLLDLLGDG